MQSAGLKKLVRRRKVRLVRGALVRAVLLGLYCTAGVALLSAPGLAETLRLLPPQFRQKTRVRRSLDQMEKRGLVTFWDSSDGISARLTNLGEKMAAYYALQLPKITKKQWDGTWFMVSFDIPDEKGRVRQSLQLKLKELGFRMYQKSLYIYPCACKHEINVIREYLDAQVEVKYFYVVDIEDEPYFRDHFAV